MEVHWLEQSEADVPMTDDWLSDSESARLSELRFAKRRADWRLGRWTAKCAVAACLKLPADLPLLKRIEIIAASTGQPEVVLRESAETATISISHRNGIAICAVAVGNVMLGCDLELIEARSDAFIADYFTQEEQALVAQAAGERQRYLLVSLLWSAKESALKAMHVGLRADTRSVEVKMIDPLGIQFGDVQGTAIENVRTAKHPSIMRINWHPLRVDSAEGTMFRGWWRQSANILRTVVATPPPAPPIAMRSPNRVVDASVLS